MCDVGQKNEETAFAKNLRCDTASELPLDILEKLVLEAAPYKPSIAVISTEPLLYRDLFSFARIVRSSGMPFHITSNGFLLPKFYNEIIDSGVDSLTISVDALGVLHDKIRGVSGTFARVIEGLNLLFDAAASRGSGPKVSLNCTITPDNYFAIYDLYRYFSKYPLSHISFSHLNFITEKMADIHNRVSPPIIHVGQSSLANADDLKKIDTDILFERSELISKNGSLPFFFTPRLATPGAVLKYYNDHSYIAGKNKCLVPWFSTQIIASGDVIPLTRCFNLKFGNIREQSFTAIWNGEKICAFRKMLREKKMYPACTRCCGVL